MSRAGALARAARWIARGVAALALAAPLLVGLAPAPARADERWGEVVSAPFARAWAAVVAGLQREGWEIDHADRALGLVVTTSRRLAGEPQGARTLTQRVRLRLAVTPLGPERTAVTVVREVFLREWVLGLVRDEPVVAHDAARAPRPGPETRVLDAIRAAL